MQIKSRDATNANTSTLFYSKNFIYLRLIPKFKQLLTELLSLCIQGTILQIQTHLSGDSKRFEMVSVLLKLTEEVLHCDRTLSVMTLE